MRNRAVCYLGLVLLLAPRAWAQPPGSFAPPHAVTLLRMPDEPPAPAPVTPEALDAFYQRWGPYLLNAKEELRKPAQRDFARVVLGQTGLLAELEHCWQDPQVHVLARVRFIPWDRAFNDLDAYVAPRQNPAPAPALAQLGDTWLSYFNSRPVLVHDRDKPTAMRFTYDARLLWYDRKMLSSADVADTERFTQACKRVTAHPPPDLVAPFALPGAAQWELLHTLATVFYMFDPAPLMRQGPKWQPWELDFTSTHRREAVAWLQQLAEQGCLVVPDETSETLTGELLAGKYACTLAPPSFALRARQRYGAAWPEHIGVAWPPSQPKVRGSTFLGGSLLVILAPRPPTREELQDAEAVRAYLCGAESERRYVSQELGFIPGDPKLFSAADAVPPNLEKQALDQGRSYPPCPLWASAVEDNIVRDRLYFFFRSLDLLGAESPGSPARTDNERGLWRTLSAAQTKVNTRCREAGAVVLLRLVLALAAAVLLLAVWLAGKNYRLRRRIREMTRQRVELARQYHAQREATLRAQPPPGLTPEPPAAARVEAGEEVNSHDHLT